MIQPGNHRSSEAQATARQVQQHRERHGLALAGAPAHQCVHAADGLAGAPGLLGDARQHSAHAGHTLFGQAAPTLDWAGLRQRGDFAGLGYHSPNMVLAHGRQLPRGATGFDQEAIASLILSGCFVGFLPEHYAAAFVARGQMQAVRPRLLHYECDFVSVLRRSPQPARAALAFHRALLAAHAALPIDGNQLKL